MNPTEYLKAWLLYRRASRIDYTRKDPSTLTDREIVNWIEARRIVREWEALHSTT